MDEKAKALGDIADRLEERFDAGEPPELTDIGALRNLSKHLAGERITTGKIEAATAEAVEHIRKYDFRELDRLRAALSAAASALEIGARDYPPHQGFFSRAATAARAAAKQEPIGGR